ncbi:MAG: site-specific integrase [Methanobrevibacter sp.]|nr:site-specific integrase [Methanobrevibacter sp.]
MCMIIIEFAKRLATNRGFSKNTISIYLRSLNFFDDFLRATTLGERGVEYPHTIEMEDIEEFTEQERANGKGIKTVNNYLA